MGLEFFRMVWTVDVNIAVQKKVMPVSVIKASHIQSCKLSQAAQARLRNPQEYLHYKPLAPLPHCEKA